MTEKMNKGRTKLDNKIGEGREGKGSGRRRCAKDTVGIKHRKIIQQMRVEVES